MALSVNAFMRAFILTFWGHVLVKAQLDLWFDSTPRRHQSTPVRPLCRNVVHYASIQALLKHNTLRRARMEFPWADVFTRSLHRWCKVMHN
ncbi:hypothetical protein C8Q72DRAFT_106484 [Fomitopsis betulina]|nr:hypothetical protein C8Q72DRAFT_106484 [Fomitopsis betulina]